MHDDPQGAEAPAGNANALPNGARLFEFEIERVLGVGGFAIVYLAFDHSLHRRIALKEYLPVEFAFRHDATTVLMRSMKHRETFDAGLKSFVQEARFLAQFEHPSLVKVHRVFEAHGTAYMVQGYYAGATLRERLKAGQLFAAEAELRALIVPLLEAVELLHSRHCLHRDIAPDNVIVQPNGVPVLLDFGAARRIIGDMTQALTAVLKPSYAPIEQYTEEGGLTQGPWTDVYGLAAVLRAAITGKPPPGAIGRTLKDSLVPFEQSPPPGFGTRFLRGIDAGLALLPENRPQSIAEFRAALGLDEPVRQAATPGSSDAPSPRMAADQCAPATTGVPVTGVPSTTAPATGMAPAAAIPDDDDAVTIPRSHVGRTPPRAPITTAGAPETPTTPRAEALPPAAAPPVSAAPRDVSPAVPVAPAPAKAAAAAESAPPLASRPETTKEGDRDGGRREPTVTLPPDAVEPPSGAGTRPPVRSGAPPSRRERNTARNAAIVVALLAIAAVVPFVYLNVADDFHGAGTVTAVDGKRVTTAPRAAAPAGNAAPLAERESAPAPVAATSLPPVAAASGTVGADARPVDRPAPGAVPDARTAAPVASTPASAPTAAAKPPVVAPPSPRDAPPPAARSTPVAPVAATPPAPKPPPPESARVATAPVPSAAAPAPAVAAPAPAARPSATGTSAGATAPATAAPTATGAPPPGPAAIPPGAPLARVDAAPAKAPSGPTAPEAVRTPAGGTEVAKAEPSARPPARRRVERVSGDVPDYPRDAARQGIRAGRIVALVQIDERGNVTDVNITRSEPPRVFDRAARAALQGWKFRAEGDKYVGEVEINFSLNE